MSKPVNGGPAFPAHDYLVANGIEGMSLRDWFASTASEVDIDYHLARVADGRNREAARYAYADAMLAQRHKEVS